MRRLPWVKEEVREGTRTTNYVAHTQFGTIRVCDSDHKSMCTEHPVADKSVIGIEYNSLDFALSVAESHYFSALAKAVTEGLYHE